MRRGLCAIGLLAATVCGGPAAGRYELPSSQSGQYQTAYVAVVVASTVGHDLAPGAGEHVIVRSNWDLRTDMGGWTVEDADGNRLRLGIGRQLEPETDLRVHASCGEDSDEAVFACLDQEVLDDTGDVVRLLDAGGSEVARFAYGAAVE